MSHIAITADIHFGVPGRLDDILYACKTMREYCKLANIDTILVLGDLFHDRRYLEIDVLSATYKFFEEAKNDYGQRWVVFPGNHDMFLRHSWKINSLTSFSNVTTIIEDICKLEIERQNFWILPFITLEKSYMTILNNINNLADEHDILLTHIGVNGAVMNTCFTLKDWGLVNFDDTKFKRIYTGHFHSKQSIDNRVYYPGSPIPFKFDEGDVAHGFYDLDLDSLEHKFINIWKAGKRFFPNDTPPPQYCNILDTQIDQLTNEDISHNKIRIALSSDTSEDKKREIKEKLSSLGATSVGWMELKQTIKEDEIVHITDLKTDLFKVYLETNPKLLKDYDLELMVRLNSEIIRDGDEQYSLSQNLD
jgi:DNA repair exonuclease SbcCD nuclease subunit